MLEELRTKSFWRGTFYLMGILLRKTSLPALLIWGGIAILNVRFQDSIYDDAWINSVDGIIWSDTFWEAWESSFSLILFAPDLTLYYFNIQDFIVRLANYTLPLWYMRFAYEILYNLLGERRIGFGATLRASFDKTLLKMILAYTALVISIQSVTFFASPILTNQTTAATILFILVVLVGVVIVQRFSLVLLLYCYEGQSLLKGFRKSYQTISFGQSFLLILASVIGYAIFSLVPIVGFVGENLSGKAESPLGIIAGFVFGMTLVLQYGIALFTQFYLRFRKNHAFGELEDNNHDEHLIEDEFI